MYKKEPKTKYDVAIIGGGPAGLMAAGRAAELGAKVILIEKNEIFGKKLSITGGGRCNITNAEFDTHKFLENFGDAAKFLHSPFSQFNVESTFKFFEARNLPLVTEARNRVFPKTQSATNVRDALVKYARKKGVQFLTGVSVSKFIKEDSNKEDSKIIAIETSDGRIFANNFIVATGGLSAPSTGSTGDGLRMLQSIGHTIHKSNPDLVPLKTNQAWVHKLAGTTLSFMTLRFKQGGKTHIKKTGKILFTHFGISGPLVINVSGQVRKLLENGPTVLASIDCFPDTDIAELDRRIWRIFEQHKNKQIKNVLSDLLPQKLSDAILHIMGEHYGNTPVHSVFKEERRKLAKIMKDLAFPIAGTMGLDRAIVADGGVELTEVDFKTMSSKLHPNIYVIGDTLNITRPSGGFSLQLCWTTGYVAGTQVADKLK